MGKDLVERKVLVNCITPSMIQSELVEQMPAAQRELVLSRVPMGRTGTVDEVAAMVCWLASDECSFSTGAVFDLSGGGRVIERHLAGGKSVALVAGGCNGFLGTIF